MDLPSFLLIDNYDSFTYNLAQMLWRVTGVCPTVVRNDEYRWRQLATEGFDGIVISPGPGRPDQPRDFGVSRDAIRHARAPVLGVCLGHQGIALAFGGGVRLAPEPVHGRLSRIQHDGRGLFAGLPQGFAAVRYHSLMAVALSDALRAVAWTPDGLLMGLRAVDRPVHGVQFHPESVSTEYGERLLANFARLCEPRRAAGAAPRVVRTGPKAGSREPAVAGPEASPREDRRRRLRIRSRRLPGAVDAESAFARLYGDSRWAFWLDSSLIVEGYSRFSFMGDPSGPLGHVVDFDAAAGAVTIRDRTKSVRQETTDIFTWFSSRLSEVDIDAAGLPFEFAGGYVGCFGYESKPSSDFSRKRASGPEAAFLFCDRFIAIDHQEDVTWLVELTAAGDAAEDEEWLRATAQALQSLQPLDEPRPDDPGGFVRFTPRHSRSAYLARIDSCREAIREGESYEICLTNTFTGTPAPDPLTVYRVLRRINPAPFAALLRLGDRSVASSSPERFLRMDTDGWLEAKPIKGTARRDADPDADAACRKELAESSKDRAENLMIVDLLRNDLGVVAAPGTVCVPKLMDIESYATVHQMVSTVRARLDDRHSPLEAVRAAFPGGSMTGAPKARTMEIIDALEEGARGFYSGAIGFLSVTGAFDLSIAIRTVVIDRDRVHIGAGGAITWLSDRDAEYEEMLLKARAPMQAVAAAVTGDPGAYAIEAEPGLRYPKDERAGAGDRPRLPEPAITEKTA